MMTTGLLVALALAGRAEQDQKPIPAFPARAEAVTVDVVVVDKQGRPVRGLTAADFTVQEDGRPQAIVGFEALEPSPIPAEPAEARKGPVASNEGAAGVRSARTIVFVVDDLGLSPVSGAAAVKKALARWLTDKASPADDVTLVNTRGDAYWSDRVGSGRADLLAVLGNIQGRKPTERLEMTEDEAHQIVEGSLGELVTVPRLVERMLRQGACSSGRECEALVRARAAEIHEDSTRRARAVFGTVERLSTGLASGHGRKSIVVFSEGFPRDTSVGGAEGAIRASQRANTAVYFVDVRGLVAAPGYGAEDDATEGPHLVGPLSLEGGIVPAAAGGEYLAEATGGATVTNTNDLVAGLEKVAGESSAYYLLGYQTEKAPDGRWRKLKVKVGRRGLTVRARAGYYAAPTVAVTAAKAPAPEPPSKMGLASSFAGGGDRDEIPLRLAAQPMGQGGGERVRVLVGSEIDRGSLAFTTTGASSTATVELTLAAVSRDRPGIVVLEDRALIAAAPEGQAAPWPYTREVSVPPGVTQLRLQVKDVGSGRVGTVRLRVDLQPGQTGALGREGGAEAQADDADRTGFLTRDLPLLAALESGSVQSAFAHRADLVPIDRTSDGGGASLVVFVPAGAIDLQPDEGGSVGRGLLEMVAFVTDDQGRLLARVRRNWPVESLAVDGHVLPGDDWTLRQTLRIDPGHWTLTTAVRDPRTRRMSASRRQVEVASAPGPMLSKLGPPSSITPEGKTPSLPEPSASALPPVDQALAAVLEKAAAYVVGYGQAFRDVVAEESYTQWLGGNRRQSRSDLIFVSMPGAIAWTCFRDVFEVNGLRVRDRESRLEKLFLTGSRASAVQQASAIVTESARYNLGWHRTINVPTLPLLFLHPANQQRFRFARKGRRRVGGNETVEIDLAEIARPTLVNDGEGGDVPASGRIFVDPASGAILRTDITFRLLRRPGQARLVAAYRFDPGLGILLPEEMTESYHHLPGNFVPEMEMGVFYGDTETTARYAKYRRFKVTTEERVANPPN